MVPQLFWLCLYSLCSFRFANLCAVVARSFVPVFSEQWKVVSATGINARSAPDINSQILGQVQKGQTVLQEQRQVTSRRY